MKKLITLLLVVMLAFSSFAACGKKDSSDKGDSSSAPVTDSSSGLEGGGSTDEGERLPFNYQIDAGGNITFDTAPLDHGSAAKEGETYTYRAYSSKLPTAWNSHTYQENSATTVTGYTTDSLYTFDYNHEMNGYRIVPSMATGYPVDVTADYVGEKWNIEEGEEYRVYRIDLRNDLKFDNGDPITADTFVESMKLLLNPEAANYRADSYFSGNLVIHGARDYALAGSVVFTSARDLVETWEEAQSDSAMVFDLLSDNTGFAKYGISKGYTKYKDETHGWGGLLEAYGIIPSADYCAPIQGKSYAEIAADEALLAIWTTVIDGWKTDPNEELDFFGKDVAMPEYSWEDVGFFAEGNSIYVVNTKSLSGFYLLYSLSTDFFLVHPETYKACMSVEAGVYANTYGTSVDTYVGFGPYKLTSYTSDNHVHFEKNPYWYGYALKENANFYWTTKIEISQIADVSTQLNLFLQGKLDTYSLQAQDMTEYQGSEHTYYTDGDSTWFVAMNPDYDNLAAVQKEATPTVEGREVNKTILTIKEFRQALSFSIDRAAYALALDPLGGVAKALYGSMIISDPLTGTAYRTTEEAKDAILKFWGLDEEVGPDGIYATKDEAIASITGYDLAGARALFDQAYDIAVAQGLISAEAAASGNFEIQVVIGRPSEHQYYTNGFEVLKKAWTDAVAGTKLEGKLVFVQSAVLGQNFSDYLKDNSVDVLFGVGWTGSAMDPFGLMEAYVDPGYQYDPGWNTATTMLDIDLTDNDGVSYTLRASVYDWCKVALGGAEIKANVVVDGEVTEDFVFIGAGTDCAVSIRLAILAAVETAVLQQYDMLPINLDASANLKGMKIKYGTEEYVYGVGRGGIKYMTYNYSDTEWAAFLAEHLEDGQLNYK